MGNLSLDLIRRFYRNINFNGGLAPAMDTDCWLWTGRKYGSNRPYGCFCGGERTQRGSRSAVAAHRFSYELIVGPIPDGLVVDHLCHVELCVNPAHLEPVTAFVNAQRCRGAYATNKSSGVRGVTWHKKVGKWQVQVKHRDVSHYGGLFTDLSEAKDAAIRLREEIYGIDFQRMDYREKSA